jgi:hypothetical protein
MNLSYLTSSFVILAGLFLIIYFIFYLSFRHSIISLSDPLNLGICLIAFYLAGALLLPILFTVNSSYLYIVALLFLYMMVAAVACRFRVRAIAPSIMISKDIQLFFVSVFTGIVLVNVIVNQIFGVIPLLHGTAARADYGSVAAPTVYFLAPDIGMIDLLAFALTKFKSVRVVAGIGVLVSFISAILGGSKSSMFAVLFALCVGDYIYNLQRRSARSKVEASRLDRQIKKVRRYALISIVITIISLPAYLVLVGADYGGGGGVAIENLVIRLFGGFDGLAIITLENVDITAASNIRISEFYLYPLLKRFVQPPEFQSAGQYLIYLRTGSYQDATSGLNPNSNYVIELLLSNGSLVTSGVIVIATATCIFYLRARMLERGNLRMFDLVLWTLVVLSPFSMLLDGAYFIVRSYELIGLYMTLNLTLNIVKWIKPGRKQLRLY